MDVLAQESDTQKMGIYLNWSNDGYSISRTGVIIQLKGVNILSFFTQALNIVLLEKTVYCVGIKLSLL